MKRLLFVAIFFGISLLGVAQPPLEKPLRFVEGEDVMYLSPGSDNLVLRIMAVNPFIVPQSPKLEAEELEAYRSLLRSDSTTLGRTPEELAKLLLVSGHARYAAALDSIKRSWLPLLDADSTRNEGARRLLNTLSWTAATDHRGVYVNLLDDCMINVRTDSLRFTLDQINELDRMKYRVSGLAQGRTPIVIRLRLPTPAPDKFYLNGRALLAPRIERGYLVLDRSWRNNEELYYELP